MGSAAFHKSCMKCSSMRLSAQRTQCLPGGSRRRCPRSSCTVSGVYTHDRFCHEPSLPVEGVNRGVKAGSTHRGMARDAEFMDMWEHLFFLNGHSCDGHSKAIYDKDENGMRITVHDFCMCMKYVENSRKCRIRDPSAAIDILRLSETALVGTEKPAYLKPDVRGKAAVAKKSAQRLVLTTVPRNPDFSAYALVRGPVRYSSDAGCTLGTCKFIQTNHDLRSELHMVTGGT